MGAARAADLVPSRAPRWRVRGAVAAFTSAIIVAVALWPATTRYGVNFHVASKTIPLYEKAVDFVSRDIQARRLAREITAGAASDRARLEKIFRWVGGNIRPVPAGFPIIDDHVWNIVVRGYGADDQRTEVFALLSSYSCCAATTVELRVPSRGAIMVAVVDVEGTPRVFDVVHQLIFRNQAGDFASIEDLARSPGIVAEASNGLSPRGVPYTHYFSNVARLRPVYVRMEHQKPWARLKDEILKLFGSPTG